jgi:hypothetical protein
MKANHNDGVLDVLTNTPHSAKRSRREKTSTKGKNLPKQYQKGKENSESSNVLKDALECWEIFKQKKLQPLTKKK